MEKNRFPAAPRVLQRALAALAIALAAGLTAHAAPPHASDSGVAPEAARAEPKIQPAAPVEPAPRPHADIARAKRVALAPGVKALQTDAVADHAAGAPLQVGVARALDSLSTPADFAAGLEWQPLPGGARVAAVVVSSPGASALRAGIAVDALPEGATLRFYGAASDDVFSATGAQVRETLERNAAAGDASEAGRTFWSPVVDGDTLAVEIELPAGVPAQAARLSIPLVSHLVASPRDGFAKAASSCELDAMCYQDTWSVESNAVSRIVFTDAGSSFLCTGTLLADRDATTFTPYFLTANHCVATQTVASTVQNYWFYRATACDSGVRGASQTTFGGGTLLYAAAATDTSFLRLNSRPPAGVAFAGWIATEAAQGASVTGIHHPAGDLQKISFGNVASYWNCAATKADQFSCSGTSPTAATFYGVAWRSGLTEAGSSGSGVFSDNGRYLVGQLFGGNGTCSAPGTDFYGRFDLAYGAALSQWLNASASVTPAADFSDLWWNAAESGWGLSITQHGAALFGAWYVYDASGRPTWYVIPGGRWTNSTTFTGDVYAATGPDPAAGAFDPSRVVRTKVGSATLRFSGASQASFSYTVNGTAETRDITRQPFGSGGAVTNGYGDLWWNASESGWGLSVNQHADTLFAVWYTYASDGTATWFVMPGGAWTTADTYTGTLYRTTSSGAYFGRAFDAPGVVRTAAGRLTLRFLDANTAIMTTTVDGVLSVKQVTRQAF